MSSLSSLSPRTTGSADEAWSFECADTSSWGALDLPPSLRHTEGSFRNARGQRLSYIALSPHQEQDHERGQSEGEPDEEPKPRAPQSGLRGVFVFLHGIFEHSRRHSQLYERLCESGFCVLAYDLVSHGQSDCCEHQRRGHARRFHYFVDDTNDFVAFAKRSVLPELLGLEPGLSENQQLPPLILGGMSFGSLVAIHTALSGKHEFAALALASPTITFEWTPSLRLQSLLATPVSAVAPKLKLASAKWFEHLCRDQAFVQDLLNDPLVTRGNLTARMSTETFKAGAALHNERRILKDADSKFCAIPVLFMMGSADQLTSVPQTVEYFELMKSRDKEFKVFPGLYHVLYDDPEKDEVFRHLITWLHHRFREPGAAGAVKSGGVRIYSP